MASYDGKDCVGYSVGCETERRPAISEKKESVETGIRIIRDLITNLSGSIEPILSPTGEKVGCNDAPRPCGGSPLANWMDDVNDELKSIAQKIESIISRVEV